MSFLERQSTRITGTDHGGRRKGIPRASSSSKIPNAKKPRSRPPTSIRDHLPYPNSTLPPSSGPYSVGSMEIEVPVEDPRTISHITRHGRHILQLETVLFTLYYPASFGSGAGKAPGGEKKWSRETWLPRPRLQTAKGYAEFSGIPHWAGIALFGATTMLTKLRAYRNSPPATHWPPEGNAKKCGYKVKNQQGQPPEDMHEEPTFPLLMFSHGLGGSKSAYSSLCCEFASYGFVVCAVEHRDGSGPRTFINHKKRRNNKKDRHGGAKVEDESDCNGVPEREKEFEKWEHMDHTEEEIKKGYHHLDYIFPKNNPLDTSPNNERGVDGELRSAQIELRLCELEEAYRVLKVICAGDGEEIARQNLRSEGYVGGSSRGLEGVDWALWKHRFHIDKMTMAGHSFGAATVVEVLRHTERFTNVQAGIIYDIWGAPIKPPAEDPKHRIHLPLLSISSEAFMYWEKNWKAVMSLMNEASEHGAPAYLLTVRGSVHISQSDFSILYRHTTSFFMKATVHPQRAIDLNISASLEFLRLVTPSTGGGKAIIDRCMIDEELLQISLLDEIPDDHRPDDEYIAARLRVDHEFRTRMAAGLQRKFKRKLKGGVRTGYSTSDEIWCHYKPTDEELQKWIDKEGRGEKRIDEDHATEGAGHDEGGKDGNEDQTPSASKSVSSADSEVASLDKDDFKDGSETRAHQRACSEAVKDQPPEHDKDKGATLASPATAGSKDSSPETWLGLKSTLRDGPQQSES